MAEEPFYSSQGSHYEQHKTLPDQENLASSPPRPPSSLGPHSSSLKPRAPPNITPRRFRKFWTPRVSLSAQGGRQSKAGRQLRDITKNGANRRRATLPVKDDLEQHFEHDELAARPAKRRKHSFDIASSPPQSSPLKHVQSTQHVRVFDDELDLASVVDEDDLAGMLEHMKPFPSPVRRLRSSGTSHRILTQSFGGYDALSRGRRGPSLPVDWRAETANFVTTPTETHSYHGGALPFCTTSCNTNSMIAIGDEEGSVRLIDSSAGSDFSTAHVKFRVHRNAVMDLAFSSDDFMLATASGDQTARIVDMHTQQTMCILSGHKSSVKQVRFQPNDDNILTTSSRDGTVQVWDLRCSERGSVQSLRLGQRRGLNEDGMPEPSVRYAKGAVEVGPAHRSGKGSSKRSPGVLNSENVDVSITAIEHLPNGREHLLLSASELSASIKLWDLRNVSKRNVLPIASTPLPDTHRFTRNFGISGMSLSGDGARLYTLCKDSTVYVYSTNHIALGYTPEMADGRRRIVKESKLGVGPLYGFKHPSLQAGSFYLKAAVRKAHGDKTEMLAVGSTYPCPVIFPTIERHFPRREAAPEDAEDDETELPTLSQKLSQASVAGKDSTIPMYEKGAALVRGHGKEVTSLCWTHDGDLISISDDFTARCWRENAEKARELRGCGEGGGLRWGHGWAEVHGAWDEDDE